MGTIQRVMVTGATGFVGRSVVRSLLAKGVTPVCLVRSREKLLQQHDIDPDRLISVGGTLRDHQALRRAAEQSQAVIHLAGIIIERRTDEKEIVGSQPSQRAKGTKPDRHM